MVRHTTKFKKRVLASVISSMAVAISSGVSAQEVTEEEVVVTGIRGSLQSALDVKRESTGVVDAISAEDIGKFPDTNLAESLQRITGVAISRDNGEGSEITVRGWGPEQNLVLFNGRQMPSTQGSRSFDFANIASEGVSGVEVYKTGDAGVATGGVGAVVNILSSRPLDRNGSVASVSAKAVLDSSSVRNEEVTPELAGIYSFQNDDSTFGVSITGSYQERNSGNQQAQVGTGWRSFPGDIDGDWSDGSAEWGGIQPADTQVNGPEAGDIYSVPQTTVYRFEEVQRVRENAQLVLQYRPIDALTASLDYTYVSNEVDTQHQDISAWYNFGLSENVWTDGPIASPLLYSEVFGTDSPADISMAAGLASTKETIDSIGLNIEYQINDSFKVTLDHHSSEADWGANGPYGTAPNFSTAAFVRSYTATDFTGEAPAVAIGGADTFGASDVQVTGRTFGNGQNFQEIDQTQLDFELALSDDSSIDFGISRNEVSNRVQNINVQANDWGGALIPLLDDDGNEQLNDDDELITQVAPAGALNSDWFEEDSLRDHFRFNFGNFDVLDTLDTALGGSNLSAEADGAANISIIDRFFWLDFEELVNFADANYLDTSDNLGDCGSSFCASTDFSASEDRTTTETSDAAYVKYNWNSELGGMGFRGNAGLRYETTDVVATSASSIFTEASWNADTETILSNPDGTRVFLTQSSSYDFWLPSVNLALDIADQLTVRAAASKTISRAGYGLLLGGISLDGIAGGDGGSGVNGDPGLLPLESTNFDLSFEYYFDDISYISVGYFTKDVVNFTSLDINTVTFEGVYDPQQGTKVDEARANGATDNAGVRQYIFDNFADDDSVDDVNETIAGDPDTDPLLEFGIDTPINTEEERTVDGIELAVQHFFGDSGFGVIANYTWVNSDLEFDNFILDDQPAVVGLSNTANLVGIYENYGFSARLAYNWRDTYLNATGQDTGQFAPQYVESYGQFDLNVSYEVAGVEGLRVFIEGINITDEFTRVSGRDELQVLNVTQTGPRYNLGVSYKF